MLEDSFENVQSTKKTLDAATIRTADAIELGILRKTNMQWNVSGRHTQIRYYLMVSMNNFGEPCQWGQHVYGKERNNKAMKAIEKVSAVQQVESGIKEYIINDQVNIGDKYE